MDATDDGIDVKHIISSQKKEELVNQMGWKKKLQ